MMKKYFLFLCLFAGLLSCIKENSPVITLAEKDSVFTIGSSKSAKIRVLDTITGTTTWGYSSVEFDLDSDGTNDILIEGEFDHALGGIDEQFSDIKPLNQKTFISSFTIAQVKHDCRKDFSPWFIHTIYYDSAYTCTGNDTILCFENNHYPVKYNNGEQPLTKPITWLNEKMYLAFRDQSFTLPMAGVTTIFYNEIFLGNWNNTEERYLLFKISDEGKERYGWIKITVSNYSSVKISEIAVQS